MTVEGRAAGSTLLEWLEAPRPGGGIRFADDEGGWRRFGYDELGALTRSAAVQLQESGIGRGDVVANILPSAPEFFAAYFGALLIGATPCPLPPPGYFGTLDTYRDFLARALDVTGAGVVAVSPEMLAIAERSTSIARGPVRALAPAFEVDRGAVPAGAPPEVATILFTSGSRADPHAVPITSANLEACLAMEAAALRLDTSQEGCVWLPLYHDAGLAAMLIAFTHQASGYVMRPDQFVRTPLRWIECLGRHGVTMTGAPPFGFAYASKHVRPEDLSGMDFSAWDIAVMGAERVDASVLHRFAERFAPHGFKPEAFIPAYGLTEATAIVTMSGRDEAPTAAAVDWRTMRFGGPLDVELGTLESAALSGEPAGWLVTSGRPLEGLRVTIEDADGAPLPEGHLGEIVIDGPTVTPGYVGEVERESPFREGRLHTADAGFFADGQLYVLGRIGDMLSVRGANVCVEDLEARLADVDGIPRGRCVVIAGADEVVTLVEAPAGRWVEPTAKLLRRHLADQYAITLVSVDRGSIERTSSGKPRRRSMWHRFEGGGIGGEVVASTRRAVGEGTG